MALGKLYVATFEPNPFKDGKLTVDIPQLLDQGTHFLYLFTGVHLNYYFGDAVSHIMRYKCKIYFVCDKANEIVGPDFEHLKDNYDAHIHIKTKHAC